MIILPNEGHRKRLKLLSWPLPRLLLPWLIERRGLGIAILPYDKERAQRLVREQLKINDELLYDGRSVIGTSHYRIDRKLLIMASRDFWSWKGENILLHEVGHAVDFLYSKKGPLSFNKKIWPALGENFPLSKYCKEKYETNGNLCEQFATIFSSYFTEPEEDLTKLSIDDLPKRQISILKRLMEPFQ